MEETTISKMEKLNLPSSADITISTSRNKTVITMDFGTHPADVDLLHEIVDNACHKRLSRTEKFNSDFNKEFNL